MNNESIENCCIIDAMCGIDTSSPYISQFTDSFDRIKFLLGKNLNDYTIMIITDIDGSVSIVPTDGEKLIKESDENGETTLTWIIGKEITAQSGVVIYQIAAYLPKEGEPDSVWYSKEGRLFVSESIDSTSFSASLIGSEPNLLTKLLIQLNYTDSAVSANTKKLSGIEDGAQKNIQSDWLENEPNSDSFIKNKPKVDTQFDHLSDNAIANRVVASEISAIGNALTAVQTTTAANASNIANINMKIDAAKANIESNTGEIVAAKSDIAILKTDKISKKELHDALYPPTVTDVPTTLAVNTAYNFGSQGNITIAFPSLANEGDVIYVGFVSRDVTNLVIDTTNTFDFELIPEVNTGYEIYAKCTTNEGIIRWIVKYSEYTGVTD